MRQGCDPWELDLVATRCAALADHLRATRTRLERASRVSWVGIQADRRSSELAVLVGQLVTVARRLDLFGRRVRSRADAQRRASLADPPVAVLRWSAHGDGRWVARTGAPTAPVVVVLVPGVGTSVQDRSELGRDAARLWRELAVGAERRGRGHDEVAVVSWLGYDPPDHVVAGLARSPAVVGGAQLARDVGELRRAGARRILVVGHSYGGLVVTRGAVAGMRADELVLLGAPGLGVADRAELRLGPGADLWAAAADRDLIALLARTGRVHGPDPAAVALRLPTSRAGHGAYLDDPTLLTALVGLALHDPRPAGTVPPTADPPDPAATERIPPWASP